MFHFRLRLRRVLIDIGNRLHEHREVAHKVSNKKFNVYVTTADFLRSYTRSSLFSTMEADVWGQGVRHLEHSRTQILVRCVHIVHDAGHDDVERLTNDRQS